MVIDGRYVHPVWVVLAGIVLLTQSVLVFRDAKKHRLNHWLWGFLCLLNTPTSPIVYLLARNMIIKLREQRYRPPEE